VSLIAATRACASEMLASLALISMFVGIGL
jgi:hypothetical protein